MKKIIVWILLLSLVLSLVVGTVTTATAAEDKVISAAAPAVTADAGQTLELAGYTVMLDDGRKMIEPSWSYEGQTVTSVTFDKKGVYQLTATEGTDSRRVYAVVKNADETEYVLYENNFDTPESIEGLQTTGKASFCVEDGKLVVNAMGKDNSLIFLPQWLEDFGNYHVQTGAAMTESSDSNRWFSLVYRYAQDNYLHMCVRKDMAKPGGKGSAGGVELVNYKDGNWRYLLSDGYKKAMEYGTYYQFKVSAYDNTLQYAIDGKTVIHMPDMTEYYPNLPLKGRVALQAGSVLISVPMASSVARMVRFSSSKNRILGNSSNSSSASKPRIYNSLRDRGISEWGTFRGMIT